MQLEEAHESLLLTQKQSRALAPSPLAQAFQQRAFQIADSNQITVPDEVTTSACQLCNVLWVPGSTVSIRKRLGQARVSGGLNKRQRLRRTKKLENRCKILQNRGKIPLNLNNFRSEFYIWTCRTCNNQMTVKCPGGPKAPARESNSPLQQQEAPKNNKRKKKNSALQNLIAKNQQKKQRQQSVFSLQDFSL